MCLGRDADATPTRHPGLALTPSRRRAVVVVTPRRIQLVPVDDPLHEQTAQGLPHAVVSRAGRREVREVVRVTAVLERDDVMDVRSTWRAVAGAEESANGAGAAVARDRAETDELPPECVVNGCHRSSPLHIFPQGVGRQT